MACMGFELKIDISNQTMSYLKQQITNQCNNNTNLPLFKSITNNKNYSKAIDLYQLTMHVNNNNDKSTKKKIING